MSSMCPTHGIPDPCYKCAQEANERNTEVKNSVIENTLRTLAKVLKVVTPKGWGFTLLMFNFGKSGDMFYISSAKRAGMLKAMKEFIAKHEN